MILSKIWRNAWSWRDFLYLLQLEEYYTKFYWKHVFRFWWRREIENRQKLIPTSRIRLIKVCGYSLFVIWNLFWGLYFLSNGHLLLIFVSVASSFALIPAWVGLSNLILFPLFLMGKYWAISEAQSILLKTNSSVKIIGIAGSFGKTTTKIFLEQLLKNNYRVQATPGNINTPLGIANWLKDQLDPAAQLLIVEMDAYEIGEIAQSCRMTPADLAIVTSIGDQHLARFGTRHDLAEALLEVFRYGRSNVQKFITKADLHQVYQLGLTDAYLGGEAGLHIVENAEELKYKDTVLSFSEMTPSTINSLRLALTVAEHFDIPTEFVQDTLNKLELPDRRHKMNEINGFTVIDDSYNISPMTAQAALISASEQAHKVSKQLIVLTGGIPELGMENADANVVYGSSLAGRADHVVILNTVFAPDVLLGLERGGMLQEKIMVASDLNEAWLLVQQKFNKNEQVILLQPELTDLFY